MKPVKTGNGTETERTDATSGLQQGGMGWAWRTDCLSQLRAPRCQARD